MRGFDDVDLWRVSAFQRIQRAPGESAYTQLEDASRLSTGLRSDLQALRQELLQDDPLEVIAACLRHGEMALVYFQYEQLVWPVTLFPKQSLYHSPRDLSQASITGMAGLRFLRAEPPYVRPPGHDQHERVMPSHQYRPLAPLLRTLSLNGPRKAVISAITQKTSFRLNPGAVIKNLGLQGAMGSAAERLRRHPLSLRELAACPGMNAERASRLINALYLTGDLILSGQASEQPELGLRKRLFAWARSPRD